MNIVHLVESLDVGGLERVVVSLAVAQRLRNHVVTIVCLYHEGPLASEVRGQGIKVVVCSKRDGIDRHAARRIRKALRDSNADVLHTHNPIPHYYGVASTMGLGIGCIVNTRHGMGTFPLSLKREVLFRLAMAVSDYGISVCNAAQLNFVKWRIIPRRKARTIPNGINIDAYSPRTVAAKQRLLKEIGRNGDPIIIGTVGRLSAAKDHATLLNAMAMMNRECVDMHLVVVGDGECRAALEEMSARLGLLADVSFLGVRNDVPRLLAGFDMFVLSSRTEGYSLALVEAAASALPLIATDIGGNGEIVNNAISGLLVPSGNPQALGDAIQAIAKDEARRMALGEAARTWALSTGTLDAMVQAYDELYCSRRRSSGMRRRSSHTHQRTH